MDFLSLLNSVARLHDITTGKENFPQLPKHPRYALILIAVADPQVPDYGAPVASGRPGIGQFGGPAPGDRSAAALRAGLVVQPVVQADEAADEQGKQPEDVIDPDAVKDRTEAVVAGRWRRRASRTR